MSDKEIHEMHTDSGKTIAVFGAGTGLGAAVARRFGREGNRVALVARRAEPLAQMAADLAAENVEARAYVADLTDTSAMSALVASIESDLGPIDIMEYAPITTEPLAPAMDLDHSALERMLSLYVRTPVELVRLLMPAMRSRGHGAILVGHGPELDLLTDLSVFGGSSVLVSGFPTFDLEH